MGFFFGGSDWITSSPTPAWRRLLTEALRMNHRCDLGWYPPPLFFLFHFFIKKGFDAKIAATVAEKTRLPFITTDIKVDTDSNADMGTIDVVATCRCLETSMFVTGLVVHICL
ncbi:hypothetical protein PIB30_044971 [Stylosanthes scabra]|uniref:Uncharacterized protein n=1 Tax=Stylosanthes scabra TaxID=79078 RepID=A0ABU6UG84_9FABA|nr:hypothetical protein [Stylosanthes scabra]